MIHNYAYHLLKFLFRKKDGNQIVEETEYNHHFLNGLRIFYPEIDEIWRVAESRVATRNSLQARKKLGEIFIEIGKSLGEE